MADDDWILDAFNASAGRRAARFRSSRRRGAGMITVVSGLEDKGLLFDANKKFGGGGIQADLAAANRRLAKELAELTADTMQEGLFRPRVSSGRLYDALIHERNRYSDQFGFGVGDPEWLDESPAKYWRQIDQGFGGHVGREIQGVWGDTLIGAGRGTGARGVAGPTYRQFQHGFPSGQPGGPGGRLRPMGRKYALRLLRAQDGGQGSRGARNRFSAATSGTIQKAIEPHEYFRKAWEDFNVKGRYMATVRQIISDNFGGQGIPTAAMIRFLAGKPGANLPPPTRRFR